MALSLSLALGVLGACGGEAVPAAADVPESWSVTAWGERYEVFPEVDALVAGDAAEAHVHVTVLDGFAPMTEGEVEVVLRSGDEARAFRAAEATRPGIFTVPVDPGAAGDYDLVFRIRSPAGTEEIRGGRVRVGTADEPGRLLSAPAPRGAPGGGEPVPFLKEQQWRADFATAWVRGGALQRSARGLAQVRPPAGGEAVITAPVDGVLQPSPWPYPGAEVGAGAALFRLVPRTAPGESLPGLAAESESLEAELAAARARLDRLEELLEVEATSVREVEEGRTRVTTLDARLAAARRDLAAARAAREGRGAAEAHVLRAPFVGEVAAVAASPGAAVAAGETLARVVRTDRQWLEIDLAPEAARSLTADRTGAGTGGFGGIVLEAAGGPPITIPAGDARLVSSAPEVDPAKGTVTVLLEVAEPSLLLGSILEAEVLLAGEVEGIVVPASALVDDAGESIVYLQLSGERFVRQEVEVLARQGDRALVEGLVPGQRLVTRGGSAVRRSTLLSSGEAQGHVH